MDEARSGHTHSASRPGTYAAGSRYVLPLVAAIAVGATSLALGTLRGAPLALDALYASTGDAGLAVIDPRDPRQPETMGQTAAPGAMHALSLVAREVAFGAAGADGLAVVDLRDDRAPRILTTLPQTRFNLVDVAYADGWAWSLGNTTGTTTDALFVFDASDPYRPLAANPVGLGAPGYRGLSLGNGLLAVFGDAGLALYDLAEPGAPVRRGSVTGPFFDVLVESPWMLAVGGPQLTVFDISNPDQPTARGRLTLPLQASLTLVRHTDATHLLVGGLPGPDGLAVIDASGLPELKLATTTATGLDAQALLPDGDVVFVGTQGAGLAVYDLTNPAAPEAIGSLRTGYPIRDLDGRSAPGPTPTPTATRPTASDTPSPTATPGEDTPEPRTNTPTPTPTLTATPDADPSRTPVRPDGWTTYSDRETGLDLLRLRFVVVKAGSVWIRSGSPDGGSDAILEGTSGRWHFHPNLDTLVARNYQRIRAEGSLPDFWEVDPEGRVWTGPRFYTGAHWQVLAEDDVSPLGGLVHDPRVMLDGSLGWVPAESVTECPRPGGCRRDIVRGFTHATLVHALEIESGPDAAQYGIPAVRFVRPPAAGVARAGADPAAVAQGTESYVVGQRALYVMPDMEAHPYPGLEPSGGPSENAGYATAAVRLPNGRLLVATWIEDHGSRPSLEWRLVLNQWDGIGWESGELSGPLAPGAGAGEFLRLTAITADANDGLWFGTSEGEVAYWHGDQWLEHLTPENSPLLAGRPVTGIAAGEDGALWIIQPVGLFARGAGEPLVRAERIFAPVAEQP